MMTVQEAEHLLGSLVIARDVMIAAVVRLVTPGGDVAAFSTLTREAQERYENIYIRVVSAMAGIPVVEHPRAERINPAGFDVDDEPEPDVDDSGPPDVGPHAGAVIRELDGYEVEDW